MRTTLLALALLMGSGQTGTVEPPKCVTVPSVDGCNTCTVCDGHPIACTLAMCMKSNIIFASPADPKPDIFTPDPTSAEPTCRHNGSVVPCKPEPIDVPAIQETRLLHKAGDACPTYGDLTGCVYTKDEYGPVTTCKDKSNVLLPPAEDGRRWCHKVQP